jgi:hypothetical protein
VRLKANKTFIKELREKKKRNPKNIDQIKKGICENSKSKD